MPISTRGGLRDAARPFSCPPIPGSAQSFAEHILRRDIDGVLERPENRAPIGVHAVDSVHRLPVLLPRQDPVHDVDPSNHQDPVVLFDLPPHVGVEVSLTGFDPARLQRASEGTDQSATGGGHDVVQRRRDFAVGFDPIVL